MIDNDVVQPIKALNDVTYNDINGENDVRKQVFHPNSIGIQDKCCTFVVGYSVLLRVNRLKCYLCMEMTLNQISKKSIEKQTGLTWNQIVNMDVGELDKAIERKIGKKLSFPQKSDSRLSGRGSVYLALNRFFDFNHKKMDKIIDSISIE